MIKFDLHIHSIASEYKEDKGIVENSTIENVNVLLSKLNEHQVALFSITDHNRFDAKLYKKLYEILSATECPYEYVEAVLPGVEFDIAIDIGMGKCHIITIFDIGNDNSKLDKIQEVINKNLLTEEDAAYNKDEFEKLLCDIGLDTILIACQRSSIDRHDGKQKSLSDATLDVEHILKIGYINALEYQKPKVQGILLNNLADIPRPIGLVTGSDCHKWECYPHHDDKVQNHSFFHSKAKILPTFKGLLMAVTSPNTRFNCRENLNSIYFDELIVNDKSIKLTNGINAIIGENGSGKTTLIKFLNRETKEPHIRRIVENSKLQIKNDIDTSRIKYISQGEIISNFNNGRQVFAIADENYEEIDNDLFINTYTEFSLSLLRHIKNEIKKKTLVDSLDKYSVRFSAEFEDKVYYINVVCPKDFDTLSNKHAEPINRLEKMIIEIDTWCEQEYYQPYRSAIFTIREQLFIIYKEIYQKYLKISLEEKIKNIIHSCITNYTAIKTISSSSKDRAISEYKARKQGVVDAVFDVIRAINNAVTYKELPKPITGATRNSKRGFYFNKEAKYNEKSMVESYFSTMFNKGYKSKEDIVRINNNADLVEAIRGCTLERDIDIKWNENFEKFIQDSIQTKNYITDDTNNRIGNTLGEMSLSFYKYFTQDAEDWNILIIDQPEDNISNNNISKFLINYFNSLRDMRQLIFVTHNPLLVVNLDVDNVLYVKNDNDKISVVGGCLEYEAEDTNILDIVADTMDGGKESIEKRLKVYGKEN